MKKLKTINERPNRYNLKYQKSIKEIAAIFPEKSKWLKKRLEELKEE